MAEMMKGNEAIAEAAVRAGVKFYAGYPITPSSEIMEYLSWRLPEVGGSFVQAESELAGINMVIGAAASGVRALTASSGPGISLKQEGVSTLSDEGLSAVVITQVRYGNGLGTLLSAQCDYNRETILTLLHNHNTIICRYQGQKPGNPTQACLQEDF